MARSVSRTRERKPSPGFFERHQNVYFYVPNLIGYARVVFALYAFSIARSYPTRCFFFYLASFVCDELDGRFARMFDQTSTFGAVLDMVTDRVATSCLLAVLCYFYPAWQPIFLFLLGLDIFSHWFQMYATLAMGANTHKDVESSSFIVRFYYKHRLFMGFCCVCVEALYLFVYLLAFDSHKALYPVSIPAVAKRGLAMIHDQNSLILPGGRVSILVVLCGIAFPGFVIKQGINVVQFKTAAQQLVRLDITRTKSKKDGSRRITRKNV